MAYVMIVTAMLMWSTLFVIGRAVGEHDILPPFAFGFWHWTVGLALITPMAWRQLRRQWRDVIAHWRLFFLLGLFGLSLHDPVVYLGERTTTAINAVLINSTAPALIALIAWLAYDERIGRRGWLGIAVSMLGVLTIMLRGDVQVLLNLDIRPGDPFVLVAAVTFAIYSAMVRAVPSRLHGRPVAFMIIIMAVAQLAPLHAVESAVFAVPRFSLAAVGAIIFVGIFPCTLAILLWNAGIRRIGPSRAGVFVHLVPLFAAAQSVLLLGESLHGYHLAGAILVAAGITMTTMQRRSHRQPGDISRT